MHGDTIFAVSSGRPPAAIAVIRVSGAAAGDVIRALTGGELPPPRRAVLHSLRDNAGALLDRALVLWFPGTASATGEPLAEFHVHGGSATIDAVQRAIAASAGVRPAEAGEFTRRALANGRIDLSQAEGLADLLAAETESQRRAALMTAEGAVARMLSTWRERAVDIAALVEATLDFDDEDDVSVDFSEVANAITGLARDMMQELAAPAVERLHHGMIVVLAGPPNSGKSSLLNALAEQDAAIVTPVPGTTRDVIDVAVKRDGVAYRLIDTAGLRDTDDVVEAIGVQRATQWLERADLVLWLGDDPPAKGAWWWIGARCDLPGRSNLPAAISVSVQRPDTIAALWALIQRENEASQFVDGSVLLNQRQRARVHEAAGAFQAAQAEDDPLIVAELLRLGILALDRSAGFDEAPTVLDALFSRFCIGK